MGVTFLDNIGIAFMVIVLAVVIIRYYRISIKLKSIEEAKIRLEERYRSALNNSNDALWEWNIETGSFFATEKWYELMNSNTFNFMNMDYAERSNISVEDRERVRNEILAHINGETDCYRSEFRVEVANKSQRWLVSKGKAIRDSRGKAIRLSGSLSDITDMKKVESQVTFLAYYDVLTKLPNRTHFMERLKEEIAKSGASNTAGALLFIDLDNFKNVNDTLGHNYGDELLKQISENLKKIIRNQDIACRLGGDEFLILLTGLQDNQEIIKCAEETLKKLNNMYEINDKQVYVSGSIGIATFPKDSMDPNVLLKNADAAMYKAKEAGKNKYKFFNQNMLKILERKTKIEGILRNAIRNDELRVNYQPQYDIKSGAIIGLEALLRLHSKELGVVSPGEFIPIAEESGIIVEIGEWCLRKACEMNLELKRKGFQYGCISVNISAIQIHQNDFTETIKRILDEVGLEPRFLEIELTESVLMKSLEGNVNVLSELRDIGIKVALDDFGTGYSSLNYIRKIPLDKLKIDRSFITDLTNIPKNQEICEGIIQMAHNLGLEVIAEGVEEQSQLELLKEKLCDSVQGFLYSVPLPEEEVEKVLQENKEHIENSKISKKHAFKYTALYSRMSKLREIEE